MKFQNSRLEESLCRSRARSFSSDEDQQNFAPVQAMNDVKGFFFGNCELSKVLAYVESFSKDFFEQLSAY